MCFDVGREFIRRFAFRALRSSTVAGQGSSERASGQRDDEWTSRSDHPVQSVPADMAEFAQSLRSSRHLPLAVYGEFYLETTRTAAGLHSDASDIVRSIERSRAWWVIAIVKPGSRIVAGSHSDARTRPPFVTFGATVQASGTMCALLSPDSLWPQDAHCATESFGVRDGICCAAQSPSR